MNSNDRRYNVTDFMKSNIMPILREIDDLAEGMYKKIPKNAEERENFELIRMQIEIIKELLGFYS